MKTRLIPLILVVAAACSTSSVDPDAEITIGGRVTRQGGEPAGDVRVSLDKEAGAAEIFATITSLGLICLSDRPPANCDKIQVEKIGGDGAFEFEVKGSYTQSTAGFAATLVLASQLPRGDGQVEGPTVSRRFQVQTTALDIPLQFWEPQVGYAAGGGSARFTWSTSPDDVLGGEAGRIETMVRYLSKNALVWEFASDSSGEALDSRLLEDAAGGASVFAYLRGVDVSAAEGTKLDYILRSGVVSFSGIAGAPPSRGQACFFADQSGRSATQNPCRLTDGSFDREFAPGPGPACPEGQQCLESTFIDLGSTRDITLIVVRGCFPRCQVETSLDLSSWTPAGGGENHFQVPVRTRTRYVKLYGPSISSVKELSVW